MKGFIFGFVGMMVVLTANNVNNMYQDGYKTNEIQHFYVEKTNEIKTWNGRLASEMKADFRSPGYAEAMITWILEDIEEMIIDYR